MPQNDKLSAVIADLRAERDKLTAAIEALEQLAGVEQHGVSSGGFSVRGMSISAAAKAYLQRTGRAQTAAEIAHAIEQAGIQHGSSSFPNTVRSSLIREMHSRHTFRRVGTKWALAEPSANGQS